MKPSLAAFANELTKVSSSHDATSEHAGHPMLMKYLKTALLGAAAVPIVKMFARRIERFAHNRSLLKAVAQTVDPAIRGELMSKIESGRLLGPSFGLPLNLRPTMSRPELMGDAARGAVSGSIVQAIRDKILHHDNH